MPLHVLLKLIQWPSVSNIILPHSWILFAIVCLLQTGGQYFEEEGSHLGVPPLYLSQLEYAQYCYDATWTLAYALNQTINGTYTWCSYSQEFIFTKAIQLEVLSA